MDAQQKLKELVAKAEQGDANAQDTLAARYEYGNGVEQSYEEAVKWYRKAAEQKHPDALFRLAHCYEYGNGVEQSYAEAVKLYKVAGQVGDKLARAQVKLLLNSNKFKALKNNFRPDDEEAIKQHYGTC